MLLGSHLDTVRNAGRYDGMLGVLTAIEVVDGLHPAEGASGAGHRDCRLFAMKREPASALRC